MGFLSSLLKIFGEESNSRESGEKVLRQRLEEVFATEYIDCEVRRDIPVSELYPEPNAVNYSYGLYRNGTPIALFNVITERNQYRKKSYRLSKQIAEERGIPHMNFFIQLPNEVSYISERLMNNIVR